MYNIDEQLVSELVHCIENEGRPWERLYRIADVRDKKRGFFISETHLGEWLKTLGRIVRQARAAPRRISDRERVLWAQMLNALPVAVADEDIDDVWNPIRVHERLESFWHRHVPSSQQEYDSAE